MNIEDILQARISLLESGEELDTCIEGTPQEVAEALRLVHSMLNLELPQIDPTVANAQRSQLMTLSSSITSQSEGIPMNNNKPQLPFWRKYKPLTLVLSISAAAVFMICALITIGYGGIGLIIQRNQGIAQNTPVSLPEHEDVLLMDQKGFVEIFIDDQWIPASKSIVTFSPGMHIRTGSISSVILSLPDDSQITLGPESELVIDELEVQTKEDQRIIVLTQLAGTSEHNVSPANDNHSRYEIKTAAATGTALGTIFKVQVKTDQSTLFNVVEGKVSVTGNNETVIVEPGKATVASLDEPPIEPESFFTGTGQVSYIGEKWIIAGQILVPHHGTTVLGNPLADDLVLYEGRLLPDGTQLVDLVVLLHRSPANRFSITGTVNNIDGEIWTINGQDIAVTNITDIQEEIFIDDLVLINGLILEGGEFQAEKVRKLDDQPGLIFDFKGIVEEISESAWKISGIMITKDKNTTIDKDISAGNLVQVSGWILEDGSWLASSILHGVDETRAFEFSGKVESMEPWIVAGVGFETLKWTHIDENIDLHDLVKVSGQILEDGTWVAFDISLAVDPHVVKIILIGAVTSKQPWMVNGITLNIDDETFIDDEVNLGLMVRVEIQILSDGTWKILSISPLEGYTWEYGCQDITAQFLKITDRKIQLLGWPELPVGEDVLNTGELVPNSILLLHICLDEDGSVQVISIIIIYQANEEETEKSEQPESSNEKVMICHKPNGNNPHTIVVSRSAIPAHLGHGDFLGPCP